MKNKKKSHFDILEIIIRLFFGFIIPYIVINGIILFIYIDAPIIKIKEQDDNNFDAHEIEFTISSYLPIIELSVVSQDEIIEYKKVGEKYIVPITKNGTYKISAKSLNQMNGVTYKNVTSIDDTPPLINEETIVYTNGTLTFNIIDTQSGIDYNKIYIILPDNSQITPIYVDKSTGTVQFKIDDTNNIKIHIEDITGNFSDTVINA